MVLNSGSDKIDSSDQENANYHCGLLDADLQTTARHNAEKFLAKINEQTKFGRLDN